METFVFFGVFRKDESTENGRILEGEGLLSSKRGARESFSSYFEENTVFDFCEHIFNAHNHGTGSLYSNGLTSSFENHQFLIY